MNRFFISIILIFLFSCGDKNKEEKIEVIKEKIVREYGYTLNNYNIKKDTID